MDRANDAGLRSALTWWKGAPEKPWVELHLRSGRKQVRIDVELEEAQGLTEFVFEHWVVLDGYQAILDTQRREILAAVNLNGHKAEMYQVPGVISSKEPGPYESQVSVNQIRVTHPDSDLVMELHSNGGSNTQLAFLDGLTNRSFLRIRNVASTRHDEALNLLIRLAQSLFFELSVAYDVTPDLRQREDDPLDDLKYFDYKNSVATEPPIFPTNDYPREPLALYLHTEPYLRGSQQQPLYAFLSYYQVIEHFLLKYARSNTIKQLRIALKDPRLDVHDDRSITRLLGIVEQEQQRSSEREQLAVTIAECCPVDSLRDFIQAVDERKEFFTSAKKIAAAPRIDFNAKNLANQIADRIYTIRCRIVHAKDGFDLAGPLLPFSREAQQLHHDISLIRYVAQHVLIASSHRLTL
jgi:hypothetical protein